MIGTRRSVIAGCVMAALFALLALASGLDRFSEFVPGAARLVPEPFRVSAARRQSAEAIARGDLAAGAQAAALAIGHDPLNPFGISLLATARGQAGDGAGADEAQRVGALLGWRDVNIQAYWFASNLARGEFDAAALRLDAILRARSDLEVVQRLLTELEAEPQGRRALAARLRANPAWAEAYLISWQSSDAVLRARAAFLASPDAAGARLGCPAVRPLIDALARRHFRADANALAQRQCPELAARGLLADANFAAFGAGVESPLGWRREGAGDVRVTAEAGRVEMASRSSVTRLVLTQPLALPPGRYVIAGPVAGLNPDLLVASLGCGSPARPSAIEGRIALGGQVLVAKGCENEVLGLWLRPGNGAVTLSGLTLRPG